MTIGHRDGEGVSVSTVDAEEVGETARDGDGGSDARARSQLHLGNGTFHCRRFHLPAWAAGRTFPRFTAARRRLDALPSCPPKKVTFSAPLNIHGKVTWDLLAPV